MKTTSSSSPFRERFDYISTALAYCWLIWISKIRHAVQHGVFHIMRLFVLIFLPQKYLDKSEEHHKDALEAQELLFGNLEHGHEITTAQRMVYNTFGGYMGFLIAVLSGIINSLIGWDLVLYWKGGIISIIMVLTGGILLYIGLSILTKALDNPPVYLSYFKEFEKQDEEWLRKWKRYTVLLFVGGLLSAGLGIVLFIFVF